MAKLSLGTWEEEEISGLYGIVSEVNIVKLCYFINKQLKINLLRAQKDKPGIGKNRDLRYPHFSCHDKYYDVNWHLVNNRNPYPVKDAQLVQEGLFAQAMMSGAPLVKSLKMMDYFFWCSGELRNFFDGTFNIQLKSVPYVRAIQKLEVDAYKGLDILTTE